MNIYLYVLKYVEIKILHYLIVISTLKGIWAEVTKQNKIQGFFKIRTLVNFK